MNNTIAQYLYQVIVILFKTIKLIVIGINIFHIK